MAESSALDRRLRRLAGPDGLILGLALDHRDSFRAALARAGRPSTDPGMISDIKVDLVRELAPPATTVMLDAEFGTRALEAGLLSPHIGLVMPLEAQGYEDVDGIPVTTLMGGFSPDIASARYAADACKLLLRLRVDHPLSLERQKEVAVRSAALCHRSGLPLVIEPVVRKLDGEDEQSFVERYPELVFGAAEHAAEWGADLLKLPFPSVTRDGETPQACAALNRACAGRPWVLLGAGAAAQAFESQLRLAVNAGACGFLAGRSVWEPVVTVPDEERISAIRATAAPAFLRFCEIARSAHERPVARL